MKQTDLIIPAGFSVPEEPTSIAEVAEAGRQIKTSLQTAAAHVLITAGLCERAFRQYRSKHLPVLLRAAQMNRATFMKFVSIGRDERLKSIKELLPPGFSVIHAVSQLSDEAFKEATEAGIIHPQVRRSEIEALRKPGTSKESVTQAELPAAVRDLTAGGRCEFLVPKDIDAGRFAQVKQALGALTKKFGIEIVSIRDLIDSRDPAHTSDPRGSPSEPADR